ncbi:MAG: hypothetical protein ACYTGN_10085 [Planctomycetota bacterium]|jgi:hypothetical protein
MLRTGFIFALIAAVAAAERVDSPAGKLFAVVVRQQATLHRAADGKALGAVRLPVAARQVRVLDDRAALLAFGERKVTLLHAEGARWEADRGELEFVVEPYGVLVLVDGTTIRALSLETGEPRKAKPPIALLGTRRGPEPERHAAIAACARFLPDGTVEAMKRVLEDRRVEFDLHAHAAIVMKKAGGRIDPKPYVQRAFDGPVSDHVLLHAREYLGRRGDPAPRPVHRAVAARRAAAPFVGHRDRPVRRQRAIRRGGSAGRDRRAGGRPDARAAQGPALLGPPRRGACARGAQGAARVRRALTRAKVDNAPIARDTLKGCLAIAPPGLQRALSALLASRSPVDDRIVYYFEKHPHKDGIPGLQAEHDRARSPNWRRQVKRVIEACKATQTHPTQSKPPPASAARVPHSAATTSYPQTT